MILDRLRLKVTATALAMSACGGPLDDVPASASVWHLSVRPTLHIGVVEGEDAYELFGATSSVVLSDGRVVVANTGTGELRFFDSTGVFLYKSGRRGGGPGEFTNLTRVHPVGPDSLAAYFASGGRIAVLGPRGQFGRTVPADSGRDADFPLDAWLHGRYWIDGAWEPSLRAMVRRTLDQMPVPRDSVGYRYAFVADDGALWVREPKFLADGGRLWTIFDTTGTAVGVVETPARFDVHQIGPDFVLGRWRNDDDVNFIRRYALARSDDERPLPGWIAAEPQPLPPSTDEERNQVIVTLKSAMRNLVVAQEVHYADHSTYTDNAAALTWEAPEGVTLDIVAASNRGWVGVAAHSQLDLICGLSLGAETLPGWAEGAPLCSR